MGAVSGADDLRVERIEGYGFLLCVCPGLRFFSGSSLSFHFTLISLLLLAFV